MSALLADHRPVARKDHCCDDCGGRIPAGVRYVSQRVAGDGTVWTWREHLSCHDIYWALHREAGLWEEEAVDPQSVRDVYAALFSFMCPREVSS